MRTIFLGIRFIFFLQVGFSQGYLPDTRILVKDINGQELPNAWAGGMETPQYGKVDFNRDGFEDLIAFDNQADRFIPFLHPGDTSLTGSVLSFQYAPEWQYVFADCGCQDWAVFQDYTCDGLVDLFCRTQDAEVAAFKQIPVGSDSLSFVLDVNRVQVQSGANQFQLTVASTDIPALVDVDYDGDLDFFSFGVASNFIQFVRNEAVERLGRCDTLLYRVATSCWGHFRESDEDNTAFIADTLNCPLTGDFRPQPRAIKHVGSTTLLLDLNADSTYDALIGDTAFDEIYALYNGGTTTYAFMDSVERNFPQNSFPISLSTFPACFYQDISGDGIRDLLVAPHSASSFENTEGTLLYLNEGADDQPSFQFEGKGYIQQEMLEFGTYAYPTVAEVTGDGLADILVGNRGYFQEGSATLVPALALLENTGTEGSPQFQLREANFLGIRESEIFSGLTEIQPAVGDITGDSIPDILLGNEKGSLYFFQGSPGDDGLDFTFVTDTLQGIQVGRNSAPLLYDLDGDEDLDLLVGNRDGYLVHFENLGVSDIPGSNGVAQFEWISDQWGGVRILDQFGGEFSRGFAKPLLLNLDQEANPELLIGGVQGRVEIYDQVENAQTETLPFIGYLGAGLDFGERAAPAGGLVDNDGFPFIFVGNKGGGIHLLKATGQKLPTQTQEQLKDELNFSVYPNPADQNLTISWESPSGQLAQLQLIDLTGRTLMKMDTQSGNIDWNVSTLPPGYYFIHLHLGDIFLSETFIRK